MTLNSGFRFQISDYSVSTKTFGQRSEPSTALKAMPLDQFFMDQTLDEPEEDAEKKLAKQRRKDQTQSARIRSLVNKKADKIERKRREVSSASNPDPLAPAKEIQKMFLTERLHHASAMLKPYDSSQADPFKGISRNRARCVWSLLCCMASMLEHILLVGNSGRNRIKCLVNTTVPDDTTTRLKGPGMSSPNTVYTIMNQVQTCIVKYEQELQGFDANGHDWHCFSMPCPSLILNTPDAMNIHAAYTSHLIAGSNGVGQSLQRLGVPKDVPAFQQADWVIQVMCGDALEANSSAFHVERRVLVYNRDKKAVCNRAALRMKCCNHQLGLVRKPVVLGVARFWSTLVRLAHLYECAGFRRRVAAAVVSLLSTPGSFQSTLILFSESRIRVSSWMNLQSSVHSLWTIFFS